jgi:cell division protein FtsB
MFFSFWRQPGMANRLKIVEEQVRALLAQNQTLLAQNQTLVARVADLERAVLPAPPKTAADIEADKKYDDELRLKQIAEVAKQRYGPAIEYPDPMKNVPVTRGGPGYEHRIIPGGEFESAAPRWNR